MTSTGLFGQVFGAQRGSGIDLLEPLLSAHPGPAAESLLTERCNDLTYQGIAADLRFVHQHRCEASPLLTTLRSVLPWRMALTVCAEYAPVTSELLAWFLNGRTDGTTSTKLRDRAKRQTSVLSDQLLVDVLNAETPLDEDGVRAAARAAHEQSFTLLLAELLAPGEQMPISRVVGMLVTLCGRHTETALAEHPVEALEVLCVEPFAGRLARRILHHCLTAPPEQLSEGVALAIRETLLGEAPLPAPFGNLNIRSGQLHETGLPY